MTGQRRVILAGAATSAGTHHAGQERAPEALRAAGFAERLEAAGLAVSDLGDVVQEMFRVDHSGPPRNEAAVVRAASAIADATERSVADDAVLVVLGGDCTVTLGVLAGLQRVSPDADAGLAYFDGDADLGTLEQGSGILDATGIAHLLGRTETGLTRLFAARPPVAPARLAVLGYDEGDPDSFKPGVFDAHPGLTCFPDHAVRADPDGCARAARDALAAAAGPLVVHFDVDAVDGRDLPLANFPHYGTGVSLPAARRVLSVLCTAPRLSAVVLTEVNPSYDPAGDSLERYVAAVTGALAAGLKA